MSRTARLTALVAALGLSVAAPGVSSASEQYVGVVTDSMCASNHEPMKVSPVEKCVRDCVGDAAQFKYALTDGRHTWLLSDQETPGMFAGQRVRVTGVLYNKTNIIKVERIVRVQ